MYSFRSRRKKTFFQRYGGPVALMAMGAASASFGFLVPAASGTGANSRLFNEGLKIELDRTSPAFAALEDAWSTESAPAPVVVASQSIELSAGFVSAAAMALRIARDNVREQVLYRHEVAAREANSQAMAKAAAEILHKMASHFEAAEPVEPMTAPKTAPKTARVVTLPTAEKVLAAAPVHAVAKTISLTDLHMSREELLGSLFLPIAKSDAAATVARRPVRVLPASVMGGAVPFGHRESIARAQTPPNAAAESLPTDLPTKPDAKTRPAVLGQETRTPGPLAHQVVVAGSLEFADGLAVSNSMDRVILYRDVDGEPQESGAVWLREGRYEIFVEETSGSLVAELRTTYGEVVGRGRVDLTTVTTSAAQHRVDGVALRLRPVIQGISGSVISNRANGQKPLLKGAAVNLRDLPISMITEKGGHFAEANLVEGSVAIAKISHPHYWGALAFAHAGQDNQFELIPNQEGQFVRLLIDRLRESDPVQMQRAIVWGRVLQSGRPIAGARVELANAGDPVRPVYFDANMQPDLQATSTSTSGVYAFYPVIEGTQAARALTGDDDTATEPILFPAMGGMVSHVDLETKATQAVRVRVFDAFKTDTPLAAAITPPTGGQPLMVPNNGMSELTVLKNSAPLVMDAEVGLSFEKVRVTTSRDQHSIYVPMIHTDWLEAARGTLHFNNTPDGGTVVGFVQSSAPFKVATEPGSLGAASRTVYFNSHGELTSLDYGEPGGGYVIFGIPQGFRTLTVQDSGSAKINSVVIVVDPKIANVISHKLN